MAQIGLTVNIEGVPKSLSKLTAAKIQALNFQPLWNKAIIIFEQSHAKTFRQGGRPRWKPSKRALQRHGQTLQDKNYLRATVTGTVADSIREKGEKQLLFGTRVKYAAAHQYGYPAKGIPKRAFLGIYPEDIKRLETVLSEDIQKRIMEVSK